MTLAAPDAAPARLSHEQRGVVLTGLQRDAACGGAYRVVGAAGLRCTAGPDPSPVGLDVTVARTTRELAADSTGGTSTSSSGSVPCYGDGTTGPRVQAVYARAADVPDRSAELLEPIRGWATRVDDLVARSAAKHGAVRHVRFVTTNCELDVVNVTLSTAGDDDFGATINELSRAGLNRTDRKYLVWVDAGRYCGVADFKDDDSASAANGNNSGPSYARVDRGCWGMTQSTELHELVHMLGGVQNSAPNSTGGGHCLDEHDLLCYADSASAQLRYLCAYDEEELLDCRGDDYFNPVASTGSYLSTHWNVASSAFLTSLAPGSPDPTSPETPPSPEPTPTSSSGTDGGGTTKGGKAGTGGGGGGKKK